MLLECEPGNLSKTILMKRIKKYLFGIFVHKVVQPTLQIKFIDKMKKKLQAFRIYKYTSFFFDNLDLMTLFFAFITFIYSLRRVCSHLESFERSLHPVPISIYPFTVIRVNGGRRFADKA